MLVLATVKNANLALMFLLELAAYVAAAIWAFSLTAWCTIGVEGKLSLTGRQVTNP